MVKSHVVHAYPFLASGNAKAKAGCIAMYTILDVDETTEA